MKRYIAKPVSDTQSIIYDELRRKDVTSQAGYVLHGAFGPNTLAHVYAEEYAEMMNGVGDA